MALTKDEQKCQTIFEELKGFHSNLFDFISKSIENGLRASIKLLLCKCYLCIIYQMCFQNSIIQILND